MFCMLIFGCAGCNFYDMIVDARIPFNSKHYYVKNAVDKLLRMFSFVTNQIVLYVYAFIIVIITKILVIKVCGYSAENSGQFVVKHLTESSNCHACLFFEKMQFVTRAPDFHCVSINFSVNCNK